VRLFLIVAASIALKVLVLSVLVSRPDFAWVDPDGYLRQAAVLTRSGAWAWTIDAIGYTWNQTLWTLPPGYPVFLSLWYRHPDFDPMAAALAQIAMSGVGVVALYWLVAALHTPRAALAAAALSAFWFPGIVAPHVFTQEAVFIPLLVAAIAALAVCTTGAARPWGFAVAGVLMAAAALTRAMPLYFLPMVAVLFALGPRAGRVSWSRQAAYFGAAALLIAPYVVWLSVERGRVVLIDDHAAIIQLRDEPVVPPTLTGSARALARNAWEQAPARVDMARGMLQVYGRSWLYHIAPREDARAARRLEWTVRLWLDLLFVLAAVAAPWGLALARQRRLAPAGGLGGVHRGDLGRGRLLGRPVPSPARVRAHRWRRHRGDRRPPPSHVGEDGRRRGGRLRRHRRAYRSAAADVVERASRVRLHARATAVRRDAFGTGARAQRFLHHGSRPHGGHHDRDARRRAVHGVRRGGVRPAGAAGRRGGRPAGVRSVQGAR
jgi:hypothetical protein